MNPSNLSPLAEITLQSAQFTLGEVGTMLAIGGGLLTTILWFFGTKFVSKEVYDQDRKEVMSQLKSCREALLLTAQTHRELKDVMVTLSSNVKENTNVTHSLDKRLAILEALRDEK